MKKKFSSCLLFFFVATLLFAQESITVRQSVALGKETKVILPHDYELQSFKELNYNFEKFSVALFSHSFSQGNAVYMEITPPVASQRYSFFNTNISFFYNDKEIQLKKTKWGYRAIFGISPQEKLDVLPLVFHFSKMSDKTQEEISLAINKVKWPSSSSAIRIHKQVHANKEEQEKLQQRLQREREKKLIAFGSNEPDHFTSTLSHPRDMHYITSEFWKQRVYQYYDYKKKKRVEVGSNVRIHRGLDLRGRVGDPIYAVANAKVVLAEHMYYEGNFILLDHGNRIFSAYMHLSKLNVREGEFVKAGQLLGEAGSTGKVAGAHLHISVYMNGTMVDPLSLLCLPIRD